MGGNQRKQREWGEKVEGNTNKIERVGGENRRKKIEIK